MRTSRNEKTIPPPPCLSVPFRLRSPPPTDPGPEIDPRRPNPDEHSFQCASSKQHPTAFLNPLHVIEHHFNALTRRVTTYHILLPKSNDAALTLPYLRAEENAEQRTRPLLKSLK